MPGKEKEKGYEWDLSDIDPREVSLVDRAANKKKFVLVKREGGLKMAKGLAPGLKVVIKTTKSAIERLVSLASTLEGMQKMDGGDGGDSEEQEEILFPAEIPGEFQEITGILESILQKYPSVTQKNKEGKNVEGEDKDKKGEAEGGGKEKGKEEGDGKVVEFLTKAFEKVNERLDSLEKTAADKLKKEKEEKEKEEKIKKKKEDEKNKKEEEEGKELGQKELLEKVEKAMDERAKKLVSMFQEAATEEFKGFGQVLKDVEEIKKALGGQSEGEPEGKPASKPRTYGHGEEDREITDEDSPFHSVFSAVEKF